MPLRALLPNDRRPLAIAMAVCGFCLLAPACSARSDSPALPQVSPAVKPVVAPDSIARFDDGTMLIDTIGPACAESPADRRRGAITIEGSASLPEFVNRATVVLNGWRLRYLRSDHHVRSAGVTILDIAQKERQLTWSAVGDLFDRNGDDPFEFCYVYTVLGWNAGTIDAAVDNFDHPADGFSRYYNAARSNLNSALASMTSYHRLLSAEEGDGIAILPRGFLSEFRGGDHHVLQQAWQLDHSEIFIEQGRAYGVLDPPQGADSPSRRTVQRPSWETYSVLKDNARARSFNFAAQVTPMVGTAISILRPPFAILPGRTSGFPEGCIGPGGPAGIKRKTIEIVGLPYDYAIPLLTGWDLDYGCGDEHVTELGIWLEGIEYEKTNPTNGRLTFTVASVLRDKNSRPPHAAEFKVDVLGLNASALTDLVPRSANPQMCEKDAAGRLLLSVANVGAGHARASSTVVRFDADAVSIATPPLPAGATVQLPPITIPAGCSGDCQLTIIVDATNKVAETNDQNNLVTGVCVG
jgi:hypothetical protein